MCVIVGMGYSVWPDEAASKAEVCAGGKTTVDLLNHKGAAGSNRSDPKHFFYTKVAKVAKYARPSFASFAAFV